MRTQAGLLALASLLALPVPAPGAEPAWIAAFARHRLASDPDISPQGTWFAAVRQEGSKRSLVFTNLATGKVAGVWSPPGYATIGTFYWANDERVVVELADEEGYLSIPVSRGELYAVDVNGRGGRLVFGYRAGEASVASRIRHGEPEQAWGRVIDTAQHDGRRVLVAATSMREVGDRAVRLYQLDVYNGVKTFVTQSPMPEAEFLTDEDGQPRIAFGFDAGVRLRFFHRGDRPGWRELGKVKGFSRDSLPVGFVARDRTVLVVEAVPDGFGLFAVSIDGGERRLVARTDVAPPRTVVLDHATRRVVAVEHEPDLPVYQFVEPDHPLSRALRRLQAAHPEDHVRLVARTDDDRKAVVLVYGDRNPGQYLVLDVGSMQVQPAAEVRPWIRPEEMSRTSAFHMVAGDGFRIHGYLTSPRTASRGTPPPLVVLLHGGPHSARDTWGFDPEVQLLASDGYAVLQVNYRGSGGYGLAYQEAGYRRWGDRMVQDVVDATRRAIALGQADPGRICVYGSSFGAYAALQATVLAPDLFRCAVGDAGVYDLGRVSSIEGIAESELGRGFMSAALGDDPVALRAASPALNADAIRARVLLIHGEQDRRAPIEQAERMRDALLARGMPAEWLVEPREGHGFYDEGARVRMYAALLRFLEESTGPQQPAGAKAAAAPGAP
jgi:dipeptidyl aminopeptidase/acylaminoacyl peptidase